MYEMRVSRDLLLVAALFASSTLAERASAETVYFLMSEITQPCSTCDSYVLPISDPAAIDHARDLVANGLAAGSAIALANVEAGGDGINRNVLAAGEPLWSWHVTSLVDFADLAIELCDGTPSMVEADPAGFLANTNGIICFWGYTVTAELPGPHPLPLGPFVVPLATLAMVLAGLAFARRSKHASSGA